MQSPCVARCGLNDDDICMGCFRFIDEIVGWSQASELEQQQICDKALQRKAVVAKSENSQIISRAKWLAAEKRLNGAKS
ncbi:DUF1289 domain-containing protein [Shewanella colwelliana]|uniref:DUF1289 domain-containing protein n=1 Tax=Shewanella colwelliana TaxID=23 RepID=UPI0022AEA228|nr:DUF1289 domain-containing protein [Shewanella colwelliana]MCZ4337054.1 DUF1289 domain-containing protein [Shewanella colwelliana]